MIKIKEEKIGKIKPYFRNARKNASAIDSVVASIKLYGFNQPITADKDGVIITGHTRFAAALKLGLTSVPVVYLDLEPDQAKKYRLVDNKTGELASWDVDALKMEIAEMPDYSDMAMFFDESVMPKIHDGEFEGKKGKGGISKIKEGKTLTVEVVCPHCGQYFEVSKS